MTSFPFTMTAKENVILGYNINACYRCNSLGIDYDANFQIIQYGDCSTALTPLTIPNPLSNHAYSSLGTGIIFDITNFFT